jgi:hypothetical protein
VPHCSIARAQAYINNYAGYTKVQRLLFIADKSAGKRLELEALKIAAEELRKVGSRQPSRCPCTHRPLPYADAAQWTAPSSSKQARRGCRAASRAGT